MMINRSRSWFPTAIFAAAILNPLIVLTLWVMAPSTPGNAARFGMALSIWGGFLAAWWAIRVHRRLTDALLFETAERERIAIALAEFASRGAHDLRTPLATTRMAADLLAKEPLTDAAKQALGIIERQSMRALDLIEGLVQLARADATPEVTTLDFSTVAQDLRDDGVAFESDGSVPLKADRVKLAQAVAQLVENAATHGRAPVRVTCSTDGTDAVVSVIDAGDGIDDIERVRKPFERGAETRVPGAGLGLAIAAAIARAHGGSLTIDANPTTVSVRLPQ